MSVAAAVWAPDPAVPVTVIVDSAAGVDGEVEIVSVVLLPAVMDGEPNPGVAPVGSPDTERLIDCAWPDVTALLTVKVVDLPWSTD